MNATSPLDYLANLTPKFAMDAASRRILAEFIQLPSPSASWLATKEYWNRLPERDRKRVIAYCAALDSLHIEFDFTLSEMTNVVERYGTDPNLQREVVVYFRDNFHHRVYAYREKVFQLVNAWLRLGVDEISRDLVRDVEDGLRKYRHDSILRLLRSLKRRFRASVTFRTWLVHRDATNARPWVDGRSDMFSPEARAEAQYVFGTIDALNLMANFPEFYRQQEEELRALSTGLAAFRRDLIAQLTDPVVIQRATQVSRSASG
jgi:hypothetical protein